MESNFHQQLCKIINPNKMKCPTPNLNEHTNITELGSIALKFGFIMDGVNTNITLNTSQLELKPDPILHPSDDEVLIQKGQPIKIQVNTFK